MNDPRDYVDEMLDGLVLAHPTLIRHGTGGRVIRRADGSLADKVGIVSGGGSGHLPLFAGYVGPGLLDTCSVGNVFEGPQCRFLQRSHRSGQYRQGRSLPLRQLRRRPDELRHGL
jgi:dihydroxyacetone kinase